MKLIKKIEENVIGTAMLVALVILFINVVLRYFFNANTTWAEEFIRYAMIWITFIGASVCFRRGMHVGIDFLLTLTSKSVTKIIQFVVTILCIVFMGFLMVYGLKLVEFSVQSGQITPALRIPIFWVYLAIPVGSFLSFIHLVVIAFNTIKTKEDNNR